MTRTTQAKKPRKIISLPDAIFVPTGFEAQILEGKVNGILLEGDTSLEKNTKVILVNLATCFVVGVELSTVIRCRLKDLQDQALLDLGFIDRNDARQKLKTIQNLTRDTQITSLVWRPNSLQGLLAGNLPNSEQAIAASEIATKIQNIVQAGKPISEAPEIDIDIDELSNASSSGITHVEVIDASSEIRFPSLKEVDSLTTL